MRQSGGIVVAIMGIGVRSRPLGEFDKIDDQESERRRHRRMAIRLPVELQARREPSPHIVRTLTQNISTGGLLIELDQEDFSPGEILDVSLTLPAGEGVSSYPTRARTRAEVLRVTPSPDGTSFDIAARFVERLRMG